MGSTNRRLAIAATLVLLATVFPAGVAAGPGAPPVSPACDTRSNNTFAKLLECVTVEGVREHQAALQEIADANGGTRVSGTAGYDESVDYVVEKMTAAGYTVTRQSFDYVRFEELSPAILQRIEPGPVADLPNIIMEYSGSGDVTGSVSSPSPVTGCDAGDWLGFPAGAIALISRGTCTFGSKALNAFNAGAIGVVIYNNTAGDLNGTLGNTFEEDIPVTGITQALGIELAATPGLVLRLKTDVLREPATAENVLAETSGGDSTNVVMVGAHLDSVGDGPGIQDNGSGSGVLLEIAEQLARVNVRNKVRFAWWGAEESGLVGSTFYVGELSDEDHANIALYLNFDMVGSPNHVFFIYDGDDSDAVGAGPGPAGSAEIEKTFERYFESQSIPYKGTDFTGRSDYGPFILTGIPSGGLFTGAEGIKTAEEAALWGGTAGIAYDPCYHQACDTYDNINLGALDTNADATAYATLQYAMNTSDVNGAKGKGNFKPPTLEQITGLSAR